MTAPNPAPDRSAEDRGRSATTPTDVPARGWKDVLKRVKSETKRDHVPLMAAGVAFTSLLAMVPALVALVSVYALVADPETIQRQVEDALSAAPSQVRDVMSQQLTSIGSSATGSLSIGVAVGLVLALWSASSAVSSLVEAINVAYDEEDERGFLKKRGLSLLLTLGGIVFVIIAFAIIGAVPALVEAGDIGTVGSVLIWIARWLILLPAMITALALLYRYAPDRDEPQWRWASPGAIFATVVWLIASILFSIYVANFGSYNETYGSLGAVIVLMLWLQITAVVVVVGAEINAELERQTVKDTTKGPAEPLGRRDAYAADTVGGSG